MKYAPSMYSAPWAKFRMFRTPKIRVRPEEMRKRNAACRRALNTCTVRNDRSMDAIPFPFEWIERGRPPTAAAPAAIRALRALLVRLLRLLPLGQRVDHLVRREDLGIRDDRDRVALVKPGLPDHVVGEQLVVVLPKHRFPARGVDRQPLQRRDDLFLVQ